ncbi:hypothetical protein [Nocardia callitridis]|uniref:Uncharacterized protein n=1 Tax=Nocardia callitridis TaxID=648753 RepID=A0ABP9KX23_9NOCA
MDIGHGTAVQLWQAADSGQFRLDEGAARECAAHFDWFVGMIHERREETARLSRADGFGGFDSAQQLQGGFAAKADQAVAALEATGEAALRMKAAILRAGGLLDDADAANAAAIQEISRDDA